jgi:hypothetical protein
MEFLESQERLSKKENMATQCGNCRFAFYFAPRREEPRGFAGARHAKAGSRQQSLLRSWLKGQAKAPRDS